MICAEYRTPPSIDAGFTISVLTGVGTRSACGAVAQAAPSATDTLTAQGPMLNVLVVRVIAHPHQSLVHTRRELPSSQTARPVHEPQTPPAPGWPRGHPLAAPLQP